MRVSVNYESTRNLERELAKIPVAAARDGSKIVAKRVLAGKAAAQLFAREKSGPHGKAYYKRITSDMTGPLKGEWGPHDGGIPVGAGYRDGPPNTDLPRSADLIVPQFTQDITSLIDKLFWRGAE